ncbi:hypothetical protein ACE1TI_08295 [Alteribacillus sp. JSM 102045]|uniref:hypothetical protein n=1 Tax=Alteribacillus sp. JSM 102045 TaxID=1562101 RepID=UPI0035C0BD0E
MLRICVEKCSWFGDMHYYLREMHNVMGNMKYFKEMRAYMPAFVINDSPVLQQSRPFLGPGPYNNKTEELSTVIAEICTIFRIVANWLVNQMTK